jgi:hypothetical protein
VLEREEDLTVRRRGRRTEPHDHDTRYAMRVGVRSGRIRAYDTAQRGAMTLLMKAPNANRKMSSVPLPLSD